MTWSSQDDLDENEREPLGDLLPALDARPGPARRLTQAASADLVRSIVDEALEPERIDRAELRAVPTLPRVAPPAPRVGPPTAPPVAPRVAAPAAAVPSPWRRRLALAATVLLTITVGSGASAVASRLLHIDLYDSDEPPAPPEERPAPRPRVVAPPVAPPAPPPPELYVPVPEIAAAPEEPARPVRRKRARAAVAAPTPPAPVPAPAPVVVVPQNLPPEDLLASANDLRQRREWRGADEFYRAVVGRFPGSDAAVVAEVASAALHLQHLGDVPGALAAFHRTLGARPAGPVAEEARWGLAEAHRALGDTRAEVDALRDLLANHPHSALAPAARRRLARIAP